MAKLSITTQSIVVASKNQVSTQLGSEAVILGAEVGQYFGLNEVGARVWQLVQTPQRVAAVCAAILAEYEVEAEECERDLLELLSDMRDKGLLDVGVETAAR